MKKIITLLSLAFCLNAGAQCTLTTSPDLTICAGGTVPLSATGATSYTWMPGGINTANINVMPSSNTIYTVTGTTGTCTATNTVSVMVNPTPTISCFVTNSTVCAGSSATLFATLTPSGASSYFWTPSATLSSNTGSSVVATPNVSTNYTVTATDAYGCINTADAQIVVNPLPTDSFTLVQDIAPHTWDAYPTYSSNVDSARWYWGDGTSTAGLYPSHTYTAAGWYNICVTVTDTAGCTATYCQNDSVYRLANNSPLSTMVYINVINGTMGISQISGLNSQVFIYPNPNNGSFVIEPQNTLYNVHCTVYDVNGKAVLSQTINGKTTIDAGSLNEGIYNISLQSTEGVVNKRIVVVK